MHHMDPGGQQTHGVAMRCFMLRKTGWHGAPRCSRDRGVGCRDAVVGQRTAVNGWAMLAAPQAV
jgi:hypothetical protein